MKELFIEVSKTSSVEELEEIINKEPILLSAIDEFETKYPVLKFAIDNAELDQLIRRSTINDDHTLNLSAEQGYSTLEKILISILWKNGQISRIQHVVDGMTNDIKSKSKHGIIFQQFGRSLRHKDEPIVDQHVLRAFCYYVDTPTLDLAKYRQYKAAYNNSDQRLIEEYRLWFKKILNRIPEDQKNTFKYRFDKVLFVIGKNLK